MKKVLSVLLILVLTLSLSVSVFASEPVTDEETGVTSIPLFNCDTKPSGSNAYSVDAEDKTEGEASLKFNVAAGQINNMRLPETVDGTDYDTLEFDLYVSDAALFDLFAQGGMNSGLEITSSGKEDNQEISWNLAAIKKNNQGEEIVEGWNHIILPLDTANESQGKDETLKGPFDISSINFIRFFMVGEKTNTGIVVKIDNMRLSDWNAIAEAERQETLYREAAEKVIEKIEKIEEVTEDNYKSLKTEVAAARRAYDRLGDEAKSYVTRAALDKLEFTEAKIAAFEANPPADEQPKDETNGDTTGEEDDGSDEQPPEEEKTGCGASVALGGIAMIVMALSLGVTVLNKKKG